MGQRLRRQTAGRVGLWSVSLVLAGGCTQLSSLTPGLRPPNTGSARPTSGSAAAEPTTLVIAPTAGGPSQPTRRGRLDAVVRVLLIHVPSSARGRAEPLWTHLREHLFDTASAVRLRKNGIRVGIGEESTWPAVKAVLDNIGGVRNVTLDPMRVPLRYPLALELNEESGEQTLFFVGDDGILSGETWPVGRNVLRLTCDLDPAEGESLRLLVVPEVRQRMPGWRWAQSGNGVAQERNESGRAFSAAAFQVQPRAGEFLVIAPSAAADLYGIVGGAFLTGQRDGQRYDYYVCIRADAEYVDDHR